MLDTPSPQGLLDELRVRLLRVTARGLTDAELLSLALDTDDLLVTTWLAREGLPGLGLRPADELMDEGLLQVSEVARLHAALELGRRTLLRPLTARPVLKTPQAIYDFVRPLLLGLRREETHVLCLSPGGQLLKQVRVAEGSAWSCQVDPREVFAPALSCRASAIALVHNHPSGDVEPSAADVDLTRRLVLAGRLLCVQVIDHLIIGQGGFTSMVMRRLLDESLTLHEAR